jgi:hypothetical protein
LLHEREPKGLGTEAAWKQSLTLLLNAAAAVLTAALEPSPVKLMLPGASSAGGGAVAPGKHTDVNNRTSTCSVEHSTMPESHQIVEKT